jgi:hypothetical protein
MIVIITKALLFSEKMIKQAADVSMWTLRLFERLQKILAYSHDHKIKYPSPIIRA